LSLFYDTGGNFGVEGAVWRGWIVQRKASIDGDAAVVIS
jgi:hypothetical protein